MLKKFFLFFVGSVLFGATHIAAAASSINLIGPSTVSVGQTFQVVVTAKDLKDVDTIRLNGSFTPDFLEWRGGVPSGVFHAVSPGTSTDQKTGIFSFGTFTLGPTANETQRLALFTFRAKKAGLASLQLATSSRLFSAGEDQIGSVGRLNLTIDGTASIPEQPQKLPSAAPLGEALISLFSPSHPDPEAWYANGTVLVGWKIIGKTIDKVYLGFDQEPEGPAELKPQTSLMSFEATTDGVWYAHLLAKFSDRTTERADVRIQIDRKPPAAPRPITDQTNIRANVPNAVHFGTVDDVAGVEYYDLYIDGKYVTSTHASSYPLMNQKIGTHDILIKAYDRAGNATQQHVTFRIIGATPSFGIGKTFRAIGFAIPLFVIGFFTISFLLVRWLLILRKRW